MDKSLDISSSSRPLEIFESWMAEAKSNSCIKEATAMSLATVSPVGTVRVRVVLCKAWGEEGFTFFTNYTSKKGMDLAANANAGVVFYWDPLFRQVKISGVVEKISRQDSIEYWATRPRESQISGYTSRQSSPIESRDVMELAWHEADLKFRGQEVPCPENWGGYLLRPKTMEFWIGRAGRFHDRHEFQKTESGWTYQRLCP